MGGVGWSTIMRSANNWRKRESGLRIVPYWKVRFEANFKKFHVYETSYILISKLFPDKIGETSY